MFPTSPFICFWGQGVAGGYRGNLVVLLSDCSGQVTNRLNDHQEIMFQLERRMDDKMAARIQSVESSALDREKA